MAKSCRIPKSVNVLGHVYKVQWVHQAKLGDHRAHVEYPTRIIRMDNELNKNPYYAWLYFLHEVRHAYQFESGMTQLLGQQAMELDADGFASFVASLKSQGIV
jgi:hypothetical protein